MPMPPPPAASSAPTGRRLLVIIPDRLSDLVAKGEITPRYYNPGEVFEDVHILMTNDDAPDPALLRQTVGAARLTLHNLPEPPRLFARTLGYRPWLLGPWLDQGVARIRDIRPGLIRCHGNHLNAMIARRAKAVLGVPYVVSLHMEPDFTRAHLARGDWNTRLYQRAIATIQDVGLRDADMAIPVYKNLLPYVRKRTSRAEVIYNVVAPSVCRVKEDYALGDPPRVLYVGRLIEGKFPDALATACGRLGMRLTVVGDGALRQRFLDHVRDQGLENAVRHIPAMANNDLCAMLPEHDIFALHIECAGVSKTILEAMLAGMPIVLNRQRLVAVPEFDECGAILQVENTPEGYADALARLAGDHALRQSLGRAARTYAETTFHPARMEAKVAALYRRLLGDAT